MNYGDNITRGAISYLFSTFTNFAYLLTDRALR